ncbi:MAG: ribosome silencing factor [Planctomycetes bacterium]|nr:ribosome silencing factor [Planctomycetota bacterium]
MAVLKPRELALHCARMIDDKGGLDLAVYQLPAKHAIFDYALVATGRSNRQVGAIVDEVLHFCKRHRIPHFPAEGESGWHLIDCYEVVVHALSQELRDFYRLERLWPDAKLLDISGELASLPRIEPKPEPKLEPAIASTPLDD